MGKKTLQIFLGFCLLWFGLGTSPSQAALRLSESDVVLIVLRQNLQILAASLDPKVAATVITEVESQFDTLLAGQVRYNLDRSDKQSIVFGTDNRQILYEASASKKLPYGVEGTIFLSNQRDTSNSPFATDPAFFETRLGFEARASFLRNRFGKSDRGEVEAAQVEQQATEQASLAQLDEQVFRAVSTYWTLVASYEYLYVAQDFLKKAKEFLKVTQEKRVIGLSEDPDLLAAQALVEERRVEVLRAKDLIADTQAQLRNQLNLKFRPEIRPKEKLSIKRSLIPSKKIYEVALENRNDYQALLKEAKARDIQISIAKDQKLPGLDLFTSLELNSVDPNYGTVLGETFSAQNPDWIMGVAFDLSYENRFAKSALERGKLEKLRTLVRIKQFENDLVLQIDEAVREFKLQKKETVLFRKISSLQKRKLYVEVENYLRGRSSSDIIVRFQTDWLEAEKQRLDSELREKLAGVDLRRIMSILIPKDLKKFPGETR